MRLWILLMRPNEEEKVRRLVSVGSTVVGLLCYSYSTNFIHLFGEWNWWKIFLYLLFSCLVCLAVLFHKAWNIIPHQHERLSKFLVLTSSTVFLFFSDRASNGESDAYGVISYVAFAVMSLGCRFSELLTVFTGALIVQLMGIKLFLGAVGVVLCFIFIVPAPYFVETQGQSQPSNQFQSSSQDEHQQVIVDIDPRVEDEESVEAKTRESKVEDDEVRQRPATTTESTGEDEKVETKADDFINKFNKQQLKLQRTRSSIRYKEMLKANWGKD
ncbi:hypothetical protein HN51_064368 [Arachis hypogaea]|uniref:uncharacterized protein LOC110267365 n=1 Tax=Arachis ipaensis TaxID=130454 RepID=UPI000A2B890C|nr:uncharacterized protein LOC110267365 [Arachis ipaensis]